MKKALVVLAVLAVVAAGAAWWAYNSLDVLVKYALEHYGPEATGVAVQVERVRISPRDGTGSVQGLEIGSPAGFNAPQAARVGEIRLALDPSTLGSPVVHVREIRVESPRITYERADRTTNLEVIRRNISAYVARSGGPSGQAGPAASAGKAPRRYVVDLLVVHGAKATMTNPGLHGQGITFDLPDMRLTAVGRSEGGVTAGRLGEIVAAELEARIAQKVLTNVELLRKGGVEGAVEALKGLLH